MTMTTEQQLRLSVIYVTLLKGLKAFHGGALVPFLVPASSENMKLVADTVEQAAKVIGCQCATTVDYDGCQCARWEKCGVCEESKSKEQQ